MKVTIVTGMKPEYCPQCNCATEQCVCAPAEQVEQGNSGPKCRLCGKTAHQIRGYLHRVNEKGVKGIWECRPSCDANLSPDEAVIAAIEGEQQ